MDTIECCLNRNYNTYTIFKFLDSILDKWIIPDMKHDLV